MADDKLNNPGTERDAAPNSEESDTIRTSFALGREARQRVRQVAEKYGVTQGTLVGLAPELAEVLAAHSLRRRREALPRLRDTIAQASAAIEVARSVAPQWHNALDSIKFALTSLESAEAMSIDANELAGPSQKRMNDWAQDASIAAQECMWTVDDDDHERIAEALLHEARQLAGSPARPSDPSSDLRSSATERRQPKCDLPSLEPGSKHPTEG